MSVLTTSIRMNPYVGDGVATAFPFDIPFHAASELRLTERDADGAETALELNVDFAVTGAGSPTGGTITLAAPLAVGHTLTPERIVEFTQPRDLRNAGVYRAETQEAALDRLTFLLQQLEDLLHTADPDLSRALVLGITDVIGSGAFRARGNRIQDLADPQAANDAVNLATLDAAVLSMVGSSGQVTPQLWQGFTGDGAETEFSIPGVSGASPQMFIVTVGNSLQIPGTNYTINQVAEKIVFATAPEVGLAIVVRQFGYSKGVMAPQTYDTGSAPVASAVYQGVVHYIKDAGSPGFWRFYTQNADDTWTYSDAHFGNP